MMEFTPNTKLTLYACDGSNTTIILTLIKAQKVFELYGANREKFEPIFYYYRGEKNTRTILCFGKSKTFLGGISYDSKVPIKLEETEGLFISQ